MARVAEPAVLGLIMVLACQAPASSGRAGPTIQIYVPEAPHFGDALSEIIRQDSRFRDVSVRVCDQLEDLRLTAFLPDVKVLVVALPRDTGQKLNETLEWFFGSGGGILAMGFAGMWTASRNASQDVIPIFGTGYLTGRYDAADRLFFIDFAKEEEDEISEGLESFAIPQHKFVVHLNSSTGTFQEMRPMSGEYKVLFREGESGAPLVVKYQDEGVSVVFATFAGDEVERSPSYYGLFVDKPEFVKLFTNALYWLWTHETKYGSAMDAFKAFVKEQKGHEESLRLSAQRRDARRRLFALLRITLALLLGGVGCAVVYQVSFRRGSLAA